MSKPEARSFQEKETFDEMDNYLDGDWSPEALARLGDDLDRIFLRATLLREAELNEARENMEESHRRWQAAVIDWPYGRDPEPLYEIWQDHKREYEDLCKG